MKGQDSFGKLSFAVEGREGDFGLSCHFDTYSTADLKVRVRRC